MTPHTHNDLKGECHICGLAQPHYHPDKTKPKEWVSLDDGVTTSGQEEWWDKHLTYYRRSTEEVYRAIESDGLPALISEANRRRDEEIAKKLIKVLNDKTKGWTLNQEVAIGHLIDIILVEIKKYETHKN